MHRILYAYWRWRDPSLAPFDEDEPSLLDTAVFIVLVFVLGTVWS